MLFRILGEAVVGLLVAGIVLALAVPAAAQNGYSTGPGKAVVIACLAIAAAIVGGERRYRRRKARESS